ncbi:MgtC/SapB family protein [Actinomycetes bacterium M1A6_2h]
MSTLEMVLRLTCGVGLGTVIGFERQYRARMAGLRTNALVAAGSTLFVLLSAHGFSGGTADPTRVAAQIVSGIGFLGAGVILRDGLNVRGLNTAATLWCSAAVGALAGAGLFSVAVAGTVAVVVVNVALRWVGRIVDRRPDSGDEHPEEYSMTVVTRPAAAAGMRALLVAELSDTSLRSLSTSDATSSGTPTITLRADVVCEQPNERLMDSVLRRICAEAAVVSARWDPRDDAAARAEHRPSLQR